LQPSTESSKTVEPLVWRTEEDGAQDRVPEAIPARKRNLGRQRQNDMFLVFGLVILLVIVVAIVLWVAYVRNSAVGNGT
jgi:cell division septal protein FtsQ